MSKGWHITFLEGGKIRLFKVGNADQKEAVAAVTKGRKAERLVVLPLKDGEFEKLSMSDGQIIESAQIG